MRGEEKEKKEKEEEEEEEEEERKAAVPQWLSGWKEERIG